jgi:hypothetical protein
MDPIKNTKEFATSTENVSKQKHESEKGVAAYYTSGQSMVDNTGCFKALELPYLRRS